MLSQAPSFFMPPPATSMLGLGQGESGAATPGSLAHGGPLPGKPSLGGPGAASMGRGGASLAAAAAAGVMSSPQVLGAGPPALTLDHRCDWLAGWLGLPCWFDVKTVGGLSAWELCSSHIDMAAAGADEQGAGCMAYTQRLTRTWHAPNHPPAFLLLTHVQPHLRRRVPAGLSRA
jgi:hypothetical protein